MQITDGKVVSLNYTLTVEGEVVAQTEPGDPMDYLHGVGEILPGLEEALTGKSIGDTLTITLAPEDAYGEYDDEDFEEIDLEDIPGGSDLEIGMVVEVEDDDGYSYTATVTEINDQIVVLDFNPPLAGKTLTYAVEVLAIRDATEVEVEHGHVHDGDEDESEWDGYEEDDDDDDSVNGAKP
ncbi:MAG: peptidylprolyl isomerase [Chloroflexota bacterium]|mgnify:CR=1 FL=1|nr:peptidylprolyl isomerase [Chloroflexota bacterium]